MLTELKIIDRDKRVTDYILPAEIIACEGDIENESALLRKKPLQIGLREDDCVKISGPGYLTLDFGREICGGVRILTFAAGGGCKVRLRFGESVSEAYSDARPSTETFTDIVENGRSATNDHAFRDFIADLTYLSDLRYGGTGFRFLRIDFLSGFDIAIKNIVGVYEHRDIERRGRFRCSDLLVNDIFETAAYTVELCMQSMLWDGVKRDRLVWIGDMHPETMSILSLFGADTCVETSLSFVCDNTPLPAFMNNMAAYSLWWLCIMSDYYLYTGNLAFVEKYREYIVGLAGLFDSLLTQDGKLLLDDDGTGFFLDWPTFAYEERRAGVYALYTLAMRKAKLLFAALRLNDAVCDAAIARINKTLDGGRFKQVNAFRVLAGHLAPQDAVSGLTDGGGRGMSTFMGYYILSAISQCGQQAAALDSMRQYYNGMLQRGATTFWEDFNLRWLEGSGRIDRLPVAGEKDLHADYGAHCYKGLRHSLCHGWASGPVPFLMERVLGVRVEEPGCRLVTVKPDLGGMQWAEGTFPTPYGNIGIKLEYDSGKTRAHVTAPSEVKIRMVNG